MIFQQSAITFFVGVFASSSSSWWNDGHHGHHAGWHQHHAFAQEQEYEKKGMRGGHPNHGSDGLFGLVAGDPLDPPDPSSDVKGDSNDVGVGVGVDVGASMGRGDLIDPIDPMDPSAVMSGDSDGIGGYDDGVTSYDAVDGHINLVDPSSFVMIGGMGEGVGNSVKGATTSDGGGRFVPDDPSSSLAGSGGKVLDHSTVSFIDNIVDPLSVFPDDAMFVEADSDRLLKSRKLRKKVKGAKKNKIKKSNLSVQLGTQLGVSFILPPIIADVVVEFLVDDLGFTAVSVLEYATAAEISTAAVVGGGSVIAVISTPLVVGAAIVAAIGVVVFAIFESLGYFFDGITDKDGYCTEGNGNNSCDGKIKFGQYQRWVEKGTGNVNLWSNTDKNEFPCKAFQCILTNIGGKWNPNKLNVEFVGSGGANPLARNTIKYIATQQYTKDFKAKVKSIQPQIDKMEGTFTRVQLNMYVETYLEARCRNDPDDWITCANEGGDCLCPMGTVRYGRREGEKWAPKKISNSVSFGAVPNRCDPHLVNSLTNTVTTCPLWAPHKGDTDHIGNYGCYQTENNIATCPNGYEGGTDGICTAGWTLFHDEDHWTRVCREAGGYWNPFFYVHESYNKYPYTCYLSSFYCKVHGKTNTRPDVRECSCDPYYRDHTMLDFIHKNPYPKDMLSDSTFALQVFQMAQAGGANNPPSKSDALVKCTVANFGSDPQKGQPKICQCKRTTCDHNADVAAQVAEYKYARNKWSVDCQRTQRTKSDCMALGLWDGYQ